MDVYTKLIHEFIEEGEGTPASRTKDEIIRFLENQGCDMMQINTIIKQCVEKGFLTECTKNVYI